MNKEIKQNFPSWCNDDNFYDIILSDDLDGLLVADKLEEEKWYSTRWFYDFSDLYIVEGYKPKTSIVGGDLELCVGKCWGNHCSKITNLDSTNPQSANLNNKITRNSYTSKYAGSTYATVLSYYDADLSQLSDKAKMLIMCVDSHYYGFYNERFHPTQKDWLVEILEYPELYEMVKKYKQQDFIDLQEQYNLKGKIFVNEYGILETDINLAGVSEILERDIELPKRKFVPYGLNLKSVYANTSYKNTKTDITKNKIFSYAQTFKNSASLTYFM